MLENGAKILFGASFDKNDIESIIKQAEQLTKKKYDIHINPIIDKKTNKTNYETEVKNVETMINDLKDYVKTALPELNKLNKIDTSYSINQITSLISALEQLKLMEKFEVVHGIEDKDGNIIGDVKKNLVNFESLKQQINKSLDGTKKFDTSSFDNLILSIKSFVNKLNISNNELVTAFSNDATSINKALANYGQIINRSSKEASDLTKMSEDELINSINSLEIILKNIENFKLSNPKNSNISGFKSYLIEQFGNSNEITAFFDSCKGLYGNGLAKFSKETEKAQLKFINEAQNRKNISLVPNSKQISNSLNQNFNSELQKNLETQQSLKGDLKYNVSVDGSQLKDIINVIEEIKKKLEELQNTKITLNLDEKLKAKINNLNLFINQFEKLKNNSSVSIVVDTEFNANKSFKTQVEEFQKNKATITFDSNIKDIIGQLENSIKNINENSKIDLKFNEESLQKFKSQILELENRLVKLNTSTTQGLNNNNITQKNKTDNKSNTNEKEISTQKDIVLKSLNEARENINKFNKEVKIQPDIDIQKLNNSINSAIENIKITKKIPIETTISISNSKINDVIKNFKSSNIKKTSKITIDIEPKINNSNIENQAKKIKTIINEQLSKGIVAKLSKINYSDAIKTLNANVSKTKLTPINLPLSIKKSEISSLIKTIQEEINNSKTNLNVTIKSFKVDNALETLKTSIEEKLSNIGITLNIKGEPNIIQNLNNNTNNTKSKNTTSIETNQKNIDSAIKQYNIIKNNASKLVTDLNKLSNVQLEPIINNELTNLNNIILQCDDNIKALSGDISKLNAQSFNKLVNTDSFSNYIKDTSNTVTNLKTLSKLQSNLTSKINSLKDKKKSELIDSGYLNSVNQLQDRLNNLDYSNLEKVTSELNNIKNAYESINSKVTEFSNSDALIKKTQGIINNIKKVTQSLKNYNVDAKTSSITNGNNINSLNINNIPVINKENTLTQNLINLQTSLNEKTLEYKELKEKSINNTITQQESQQLEKVNNDINSLITSYKQLNQLSETLVSNAKLDTSTSKLDSKYSKLVADVTKFMGKNGQATNDYNIKSQLEQIISEASDVNLSRNMNHLTGLQNKFNLLQSQISKLGKTGKSVAQELDDLFSKIGLKAILGTMIYRVIGYFKEMVNSVIEVDTSMVLLKRVTSETSETYEKFLKNASADARKLGSTLTNVIDSVANFSRLGYNLKDATILGNLATMYSTVGLIDIDTATKDIISSMKAFNIEADRAITIVDSFNELGNKFALSSADVGAGLTQSASALAVAGNDINQSIAMITGATEITQDSNSVGNALKVLSMRIRGSKTDLEDMGEEVDDLTNSTSKMRDEIKAISGVDIMSDSQTYKSTFQIMREISKIWNKLSDVNKAGLLEKLAGKNRANINCLYVQKCA